MSVDNVGYIHLQRNKEIMPEFSEKSKSTPIAKVAPEVKQFSDQTEITKTCAVMGCDDSKNLNSDEFFRFPEDPSMRQIWTDLTGRNNWTPTDFSYVCIQHFSVDCFACDSSGNMILLDKSVPSLKLPKHVLEVEYIEEDSLASDEEMSNDYANGETLKNGDTHTNGDIHNDLDNTLKPAIKSEDQFETIKLFEEVKRIQIATTKLRSKHRHNMRVYNSQNLRIRRLRDLIAAKKKAIEDKRNAKVKVLLSMQDKIKEDQSGLVMAMPAKHTDDIKNFSLNIYKYSPQAYIYIRNMLRTTLPSTEVLDSWLQEGFEPKDLVGQSSLVKVTVEQCEKELVCRITMC